MKAVPSFEVYTPSSLREVLSIYSSLDGEVVLYAGGTDLMPFMRRGKIRPRAVVDLSGVRELRYVRREGDLIHVGGLTTVHDLATSPAIPLSYFSIRWLRKYFGAETTRHMATVGGNLASGGERDIPAIMASLDGEVKIVGADGEKVVGPLGLTLSRGEVIVEAIFRDWGPGSVSWFGKFEKRASNGIGVVTAAVSMKAVDGVVEKIGVVLNRVEGRTMGRLTDLENALVGKTIDPSLIKAAVEESVSRIRPASDFRASSSFRKHVSKVLVRRGLEFCWSYLTRGGSVED
ncbi:MAG: FAD binding domain-containing protein [Candidatus Caldarchaeum sp.]|nr:FAD binding domain-containing protein [Candidatus Caldarchaeales archaeon]